MYFDFKHVEFYASLKFKMTKCIFLLLFFGQNVKVLIQIFSVFEMSFLLHVKIHEIKIYRCVDPVFSSKGCDKVSNPMLLQVSKLQYLVPFSWFSLQFTAEKDRISVYEP